ncbi:hypothetical protein KJA15_01290 [Patescibacteria group bacterium]|nr:hypothetical protein [Patescibacteria group bacterium]
MKEKNKLKKIKYKIKTALDQLYKTDYFLFEKDLCERCINHKFAIYLEQQSFGKGYFIDCEYNKSHLNQRTSPKRVSSEKGNYIDIIITKRDGNYRNDFICFEVKKWKNYRKKNKDIEKLQILTKGIRFGYDYGFYVILGRTRDETKVEIYKGGKLLKHTF